MLNRYHAQRQHIISSLDALLYQLYTLSFFFAPSVIAFFCRVVAHSIKPKDDDISHSLRFYLALLISLNLPSLWYHSTHSSSDERAIILDFVGLAYVPSRLQLITLDLTIILLQIILVTIAYETSLSVNSSEPDFLTPLPPLELPSHSPSFSRMEAKEMNSSHYIIDLQFKQILSRLRHPPTIRPGNTNTSGSFPNLAPWPLHSGVGMALLRAGRRARTGGNSGDRRVPENPDTANQTEA